MVSASDWLEKLHTHIGQELSPAENLQSRELLIRRQFCSPCPAPECKKVLVHGHWVYTIGQWVWGFGHWALGIEHWALGIGYRAFSRFNF